jgi:hypothetical protein
MRPDCACLGQRRFNEYLGFAANHDMPSRRDFGSILAVIQSIRVRARNPDFQKTIPMAVL